MHLNARERSILRTIAYFDMLEYPLTATEIWKWLYRPEQSGDRGLEAILKTLNESSVLQKTLSAVEGFYCMRGREWLIRERKVRNNRMDRQMRRVQLMTQLLRFIPSIRMIAIASSLSTGNVKQDGDIDLFIVTQRDRIWMTRLLAVGFLKLLRQRPTPQTRKNKFCLSFLVTEDALDVERASFGPDDIAFQYYVQSFAPVYDTHDTYRKFLRANSWLSRVLPNGMFEQRVTWDVACPPWLRALHAVIACVLWPFFNGPLSEWYPSLQLRIMPSRLKSIANIDSRVIISDTMLKFHDKDNRHELRRRWEEQTAQYA